MWGEGREGGEHTPLTRKVKLHKLQQFIKDQGVVEEFTILQEQGGFVLLRGDQWRAIHCRGAIPLPTPNPGFCTMPPRGGPLMPPPSPPRGPPGPRRRFSRRSPSRAARVFFSSTLSRTSPLNMMGCKSQVSRLNTVLMGYQLTKIKYSYYKESAAYKSPTFSPFSFYFKF